MSRILRKAMFVHILLTIREDVVPYWQYLAESMNDREWGMVVDCNGYPFEWTEVEYRSRLFKILWDGIRQTALLAVCAVRGHDMHDDGWADPDSGCIDMCCHRCGKSWDRVYLY